MKKFRLGAAFLIFLLILTTSFSIAYAEAPKVKLPNPTVEFYCNDFADIIDASTERYLVSLGESNFKATEGGQVVFVSIDTLNDGDIDDYANTLFNKWKIGTKDKGVLFILSMKEREARIEVGYGYEGVLTDIQSSKLLDKFSELNREKGMDEAVKVIYTDICNIVSGDGDSVQYPDNDEFNIEDNFFVKHPILAIILAVIVLILIVMDFVLTGGRITFFIIRMALSSSGRGGRGGRGGRRNSGGGGRSGGGGASGRF